MRIGIFTDSYYPLVAGVATSIEMLKNALEDMGHTVYIVAQNLENHKFVYDKKNKIIRLPGIKTSIPNIRITSVYSAKAMKIIKNEWNLDVIHSQTEGTVGAFSHIVAKKLNLPVVHTYHTLYEDYVYYVTHGHFDNLAKKSLAKLTKYYYDNKCDELIVPTDKIKSIFNKKYHINREIHVIPSGIDIKKFYPTNISKKKAKEIRKRFKIDEDDFVIGSVGRLAREKSFDKVIIELSKLVKMNPKIKFLLVGYGVELDNLKALAKELQVDKNVIFTGLVEPEDVQYYYQAFDVMVSFSKTETQGMTIVEALASSLPTVCIDDTSFRDIVQTNYNGYLFETEEEFRKYILNLCYDKELYKEMSINAKNSVYSYSKEVFASKVLKVYHKAIDKKKKEK